MARRITMQLLVSVLTVLLVVQSVTLVFSSLRPSTPLSVEPAAVVSEFLLSDVCQLSGSKRRYSRTFAIASRSDDSLELSVESASCGCLAFSADGKPKNLGSVWELAGQGVSSLGVTVPIRNSVGSDGTRFTLVARQKQSGEVVFRRAFDIRTTVRPDLVCIPPVLRLDLSNPEKPHSATIHVDHLVPVNAVNASAPDVSIDFKGNVLPIRVDSVKQMKAEKLPDSDLVRINYSIVLRIDLNVAGSSSNELRNMNSTAQLKLQIPRSDGVLIQESVPFLLASQEE